MLLLQPKSVRFGDTDWAGVRSVAIDYKSEKAIAEWSDDGPHVVFADVARQKVVIRVTQELGADDLVTPGLGEAGTLALESARNASGADVSRVDVSGVVTDVTYTLRGGASATSPGTRTITLIAVSADGTTDPVRVTPVG